MYKKVIKMVGVLLTISLVNMSVLTSFAKDSEEETNSFLSTIESNVIMAQNVNLSSDVSASFINERLENTSLRGLGEAFKKAEEDYGVNAVFLVGLAMHESNNGNSNIAVKKNNLFGFQAYDATPFESAASFSSKEESILHVAEYLSENYLSNDGKYFSGYGISDIGKRYATDPNWDRGVESRIIDFLNI